MTTGIAVAGLGVAHRAEDALEVRPLEGQQLIQRRLAFLHVGARIICCTIGRRSCSINICSVRQRPMPSAPNVMARWASRG